MIKIYFDLCTADSNLILYLYLKFTNTTLHRPLGHLTIVSKVRILYLAAQSLDVRVYH